MRERAFAFFSIEVNVRAYDQTLSLSLSLFLSLCLCKMCVHTDENLVIRSVLLKLAESSPPLPHRHCPTVMTSQPDVLNTDGSAD